VSAVDEALVAGEMAVDEPAEGVAER